MANIKWAEIQQSTREARGWIADFTDDLPSGVTVSAGTAYHTPPSGSAGTPTLSVVTPYVTATLGTAAVAVTGVHYLEILGTYSNGETASIRIAFAVNYPATTARAGMLDLIGDLRAMTDAGPVDYQIAGVPYWSDAQLQTILDHHRNDFYESELYMQEQTTTGGSVFYQKYYCEFGNLESGTAYFDIQDSTGASTTAWTADYRQGLITFNADTLGTVFYATGRSYDLNAAAAEVWRQKASQAAKGYDFSTDNHNLNRSQIYKQYMEQSNFYARLGAPRVVTIVRGDT